MYISKEKAFQRCTKCVMDTTDSKITFDENGVCDWCRDFESNIYPNWKKQLENKNLLKETAAIIKKKSKKQKYDCIIGMSGGIDSSYLCYVAKEIMGLNPLVYCVDTGWNLKIADDNIDKICNALKLDKYVEKINWDEMKDLQLSFFKSQVPYQDFPQDHAIFAGLYNFAIKNKIKYVLTGANNSTECIRPPMEWVYINDIKLMKDIHKKFGNVKLKTFPMCSMFKYRIVYPFFHGLKRCAPLNMIEYNKEEVKDFLIKKFNWNPYEHKHYEDIFTRWYEGYYLIHKFGYDKRKSYLSNLILTGQITRDEALKELEKEPYSKEQIEIDTRYIADKLGIDILEFNKIIDGDNKTYKDYKNSIRFINFSVKLMRLIGKENKKFR